MPRTGVLTQGNVVRRFLFREINLSEEPWSVNIVFIYSYTSAQAGRRKFTQPVLCL